MKGEIRFKDFLRREGERLSRSPRTIHDRWMAGEYPDVRVRRVNAKLIFVKVGSLPKAERIAARGGEMPLREFVVRESRRRQVKDFTIYEDLREGRYPGVTVRQAGRRKAFVKIKGCGLVNHDARTGEVPLKEFVAEEAIRCRVSPSAIHARVRAGMYPGVTVRRVAHSVAFVRVDSKQLRSRSDMEIRPGEVPLKEFVVEEARRMGVRPHAIYMRWYRGEYSEVPQRRVNARLVFVRPNQLVK